jgi:putative radical SAM enzyme (TIGR03279 family)
MAISTPAQNPLGAARRTRSTGTRPGYRRPVGGPPVAWDAVPAARVVAVAPGSPAARAGLAPGDEIVSIGGRVPRDVIQYRLMVDEPDVEIEVDRGGVAVTVEVAKGPGEPLGADVASALFDRVQTCDNACEFCFIHQLPPGLRRSLYLKDDDYRLSFLYGNFTTLTRFTEADLERVVTERLSPLHVSIHATDPDVRAAMLRNRRGATSLRWLRALLDAGIEVHGQVVVCPGVNDGAVLDGTLADVLDRYPELATLCVVPLGISRFSRSDSLRPHTPGEAAAVVDAVEDWQGVFLAALGRRLAFAADEYYLLAGRPFPPAEAYEGFPMHEDGVGMARTLELELTGGADRPTGVQPGFFAWVDGAPADGYRAPRLAPVAAAGPAPGPAAGSACGTGADASAADPAAVSACGTGAGAGAAVPAAGSACGTGAAGGAPGIVTLRPRRDAPVAVLTGTYGAAVLRPLLDRIGRPDVRVVPVENRFFGGTVGVAGLLVGEDLARVLAAEPEGHRYLLPDVCLSRGVFLDGTRPEDLPRPVEVVPTDGIALRAALGGR